MVVSLVLEPDQMVVAQLMEEEQKVKEGNNVEDHHPQ